MISKKTLLKYPNYLLSKYQAEIYRQLTTYMKENDLSQKQIAEQLGVSSAYVNQILKGNFNYTLKKLIEISLLMGKVPSIEFLPFNEFWNIQGKKREGELVKPQSKLSAPSHETPVSKKGRRPARPQNRSRP